jgi:BMFP domain-containing protein YqiC
MTERPKFFDDLAGVAGGALSALAGAREELTALVKARIEETITKLDLVRREEFEVVAELARRARAEVEVLSARLDVLESKSQSTVVVETPAEAPPEVPDASI